jgi:rsbT co-antagonist protein RsbR
MAESMDFALSTYKQAQQALLKQILDVVRLAVVVVLVLSLGGLIFPTIRVTPVVLLAVLLAIEFGVTELCRWLTRRDNARAGAITFVVMTMIVASLVAGVLGFPAFAALAGGVLISITALLIGPRYTLVPGVICVLFFIALSVVDRQGWLADIAVGRESWPGLLIQIGFVAAATAVLAVVCTLASERLGSSAREAHERAVEAERAHAAQIALSQQLEREVGEQRRLLNVIQELETPIMPVLVGVLVLPLVGHLDSRRLAQIEGRLLQRVVDERADLVLIDITGVPLIETLVASELVRLGQAIRLLGTRVALTGLRAATAQALVALDVELTSLSTYATLQDALAYHTKA